MNLWYAALNDVTGQNRETEQAVNFQLWLKTDLKKRKRLILKLIMCICVCVLHGSTCLTLCNPMDCSSSGSSVHGIFQARILEWAAILYSIGSFQPRDWTCVSCISCIGRQIFYHYITWEVSKFDYIAYNSEQFQLCGQSQLHTLGPRTKHKRVLVAIEVATPWMREQSHADRSQIAPMQHRSVTSLIDRKLKS